MAQAKLEDLLPILDTVLSDGGEVSFTPNGNSMRPLLISGRDTITLKRFNRHLKKYALPLYRRENGQFVLHRVVGENNDGYIMRGDNQLDKEYGIKQSQIIGEVVAYVRDGKAHKTTDFSYKVYVFLRCNCVTLLLRKLKNKIRIAYLKQKYKQHS